jgi:hypothetical protein
MLPDMALKAKKAATNKMQAYRDRLRAQGLKPVQLWMPDVNAPGFEEELRRQVASLDPTDEAETMAFIEAVGEFPPH